MTVKSKEKVKKKNFPDTTNNSHGVNCQNSQCEQWNCWSCFL